MKILSTLSCFRYLRNWVDYIHGCYTSYQLVWGTFITQHVKHFIMACKDSINNRFSHGYTCSFFWMGYVEERLWWPIQSPNIGRKHHHKSPTWQGDAKAAALNYSFGKSWFHDLVFDWLIGRQCYHCKPRRIWSNHPCFTSSHTSAATVGHHYIRPALTMLRRIFSY